jgi:hypothetical protein
LSQSLAATRHPVPRRQHEGAHTASIPSTSGAVGASVIDDGLAKVDAEKLCAQQAGLIAHRPTHPPAMAVADGKRTQPQRDATEPTAPATP